MHFLCSLSGGITLLSLVAAVPLEKRAIGYGDRSEYAAEYAASGVSSYAAISTVLPNTPAAPQPTGGAPGQGGYSSIIYGPPSQSMGSPGSQPTGGTSSGTGAGQSGDVTFPLANGFPDIQNPSEQLNAINQAARGTLSNAPPPAKAPGPETITSLKLIAFNEIFEVFYFTELLNNVTNNVEGYRFQDQNLRRTVIEALTAVQAQEQLHTLNANGALKRAGVDPIKACKYNSPVSDFKSAIALASTFTDVVLGTLGDASVVAGTTGDGNLVRGFAASLGQEGEQNGFYRQLLGKVPSALPFLTASTRQFAFSALNQNFVVPGSCPNANTIDLPIFGTLNVLTKDIQPRDQKLQFSFNPTNGQTGQGMSIVYINQQLVPIVLPLESLSTGPSGDVVATAFFPYTQFLMNGLTIAALVDGAGPFPNVTSVSAATKFGPGLIEIN